MIQDIEKLKNELQAKQGLSVKIANLKSKISEVKSNSKHTILVDNLGSMACYVGSQPAVDIVREVLSNFTGAKIYEFNSTCKLVKTLGEPRGGTTLHLAFIHLKNESINEFTLITDGEPDSEGAALMKVKNLIQTLCKLSDNELENEVMIRFPTIYGDSQLNPLEILIEKYGEHTIVISACFPE